MYKIIGVDGREYGPITADVLKEWIGQGRANAHTRVLAPGTTEWRELGELPEFAKALGARAAGPPGGARPPAENFRGAEAAEAIANEVLQNDYRFSIGGCFSRAWDLISGNFGLAVGASALMLVITTAAGFIPFATLLLLFVLLGGLDWMFLKLLRNGRAELNDIFAGFSLAFVPLMLFSLVEQLLTTVGLFLCILPGIYLMVVWIPFPALLILDKRLDFWPAMELSRKVVTRHWWQMFGFMLLCTLLNLVGVLACGIGLFFTFPLTTAAVVVAYEEVFGRVRSA